MKAARNISHISAEQNLINKTQLFLKTRIESLPIKHFHKKSNDKMHGIRHGIKLLSGTDSLVRKDVYAVACIADSQILNIWKIADEQRAVSEHMSHET